MFRHPKKTGTLRLLGYEDRSFHHGRFGRLWTKPPASLDHSLSISNGDDMKRPRSVAVFVPSKKSQARGRPRKEWSMGMWLYRSGRPGAGRRLHPKVAAIRAGQNPSVQAPAKRHPHQRQACVAINTASSIAKVCDLQMTVRTIRFSLWFQIKNDSLEKLK